ncbi:MAG TPA: glycosyltransferase, partial [Spirochaetia bacterium]|nr:glycosyltransferase [Spirochaetia bacterium]
DQTYKNIELIVIDDGSSDGSPSVIENVLKDIHTLNAQLFLQDNCGAHNTINRGISMARGEYVAILNSDDFYYPRRLEKLLTWATLNHCEFAFSKVDHVSSDGTYLDRNREIRSTYLSVYEGRGHFPSLAFSLLKYNLAVTTSNFLMKRSIIDKVGLFRDYKIVHDWDYLLRVLLETEPCFLDEPLMAYRVHENNTLSRLLHLAWDELNTIFSDYAKARAAGKPRNSLAPPAQTALFLLGQQLKYKMAQHESHLVKGGGTG